MAYIIFYIEVKFWIESIIHILFTFKIQNIQLDLVLTSGWYFKSV